MMKAIEITHTGGPEVMQMRDLPIPEPQHGEVLIQVAASGINFVDLHALVQDICACVQSLPRREQAKAFYRGNRPVKISAPCSVASPIYNKSALDF